MRRPNRPTFDKNPRSLIADRQRSLLAAAMALSIGSAACGPDDPGNTTAGTGGTGGMVEAGGGGAGGSANPCLDLPFNPLASEVVAPGENKTFTVNTGEGYDGLTMQVDGDVLKKASLVALMSAAKINVGDGQEFVNVEGFQTLVIDLNKHYRLNNDGNCELNTVEVNTDMMVDPNKQPIITAPPGSWMSGYRVPGEGMEGIPESFALTVQGTRMNVSELNGEGHFFANTKPKAPEMGSPANVYRDQAGHIVVELPGWTDEGDGSDFVLGNLGVSASGVTFVAVDGEAGKFITVAPSSATSLDLGIAGLNQGKVDDTTMMMGMSVEEATPAPEISNLAIDCSSTGNACGSAGLVYPVNFGVTDATNCIADAQKLSGFGTPGSVSMVNLNGNQGTFDYTTGSQGGNEIRISVDCNGPGGVDSDYTDVILQ